MIRKSEDEVIDFLKSIDPMPEPRIDKAKTLYRLASKSKASILELGAREGIGTISLYYGALSGYYAKVHAIDAYGGETPMEFHDFYNATSGEANKVLFEHYTEKAKASPFLHIGWFDEIAKGWTEPLSLVVWDASTPNMLTDVLLWIKHIIPGGRIALHSVPELHKENGEAYRHLRKEGFSTIGLLPGGFAMLVKE